MLCYATYLSLRTRKTHNRIHHAHRPRPGGQPAGRAARLHGCSGSRTNPGFFCHFFLIKALWTSADLIRSPAWRVGDGIRCATARPRSSLQRCCCRTQQLGSWLTASDRSFDTAPASPSGPPCGVMETLDAWRPLQTCRRRSCHASRFSAVDRPSPCRA